MGELCEYGEGFKQGNTIKFVCKKDNISCGYIRWCTTDECIKMLPKYINCKIRGDMLQKKDKNENKAIDEIVEDIAEKVEIIEDFKELLCKVLWVKNNKIAIEFQSYGIEIEGTTDKKEINIKYLGEIGKENFKILSFD